MTPRKRAVLRLRTPLTCSAVRFLKPPVDALFDTLGSSVANGEKVSIPGWLAIERIERAARTGRNPQTGEELQIPAGFGIRVTAGSKLKGAASK